MSTQIAGKNHHTLRMGWATKINLSFYIHYTGGTGPNPSGNTARTAKGKITQAQYRKGIDLTNMLTFAVDKYGLSDDLFLNPFADTVVAGYLSSDRIIDIITTNQFMLIALGKKFSFNQQVSDFIVADRYLL